MAHIDQLYATFMRFMDNNPQSLNCYALKMDLRCCDLRTFITNKGDVHELVRLKIALFLKRRGVYD